MSPGRDPLTTHSRSRDGAERLCRRSFSFALFIAFVSLLVFQSATFAEAKRASSPVVAPSPGPHTTASSAPDPELRKLDRGPNSDNPKDTASPAPSHQGQDFDLARVGMAMGVVIGLIFLFRWCGRKMFAGAAAQKSTKVVQVLSRCVIAPKQQVLLIRVGRRVVVVGDTGSQLSPLCEIQDPDEVAELIGAAGSERSTSAAKPFGSFFGRAKDAFSKTERDEETSVPQEDEEFPAPSDVDRADIAGTITGDDASDSELSVTRDEISGLASRVRGLARQFGKS